ncbi:ferredoxin [Actinopolyspora mzabensis]|uniref:ferredoxin n=1 Tax=Actinopolyspora mzabensis TaxID=995066 RepID=UPI000B851EFC|nr:ferredoxin [Actinopolyspora mzabensis]
MRIEIDEEKCIGAGQCVMSAPDTFDQRDEDGVAFLLEDSPTTERQAQVREAATLCPAAAITVVEDRS